jgi:uncharacterized membrane protein
MSQRSILLKSVQKLQQKKRMLPRWLHLFFSENASRAVVDMQRRAVWIALALILLSANELTYSVFNGIPYIGSLIPLALTLGSFYAMWRAMYPARSNHIKQDTTKPNRWQAGVVTVALLLTLGGGVFLGRGVAMSILDPQFSNDGTSLDTNAAILLLQGRNPYSDSNLVELSRRFAIQPDWTTPLRQGQFANRLDYPSMAELQSVLDTSIKAGSVPEFEAKVSYPALSFLTLVPFVLVGNYNVLPFYIASYLLIVYIAWRTVRPEMRPWTLVLALANIPMWSSAVGGNLDVFYMLLLLPAWLLRSRRWASAIFLGLALASKQPAWFFIPFYAMMTYRHYGLKDTLTRMVIAGGVVLATNLPFIIWDPQAWLAGVLAPIADPMFPMGVGLVNLSTAHLLPYLPTWVYSGLEVIAMGLMLVLYWRICRRRPEAAFLLAVVPLFFAWRSLPSYFYCTAFPLYIAMLARPNVALVPSLAELRSRLGFDSSTRSARA